MPPNGTNHTQQRLGLETAAAGLVAAALQLHQNAPASSSQIVNGILNTVQNIVPGAQVAQVALTAQTALALPTPAGDQIAAAATAASVTLPAQLGAAVAALATADAGTNNPDAEPVAGAPVPAVLQANPTPQVGDQPNNETTPYETASADAVASANDVAVSRKHRQEKKEKVSGCGLNLSSLSSF